MGHDDHRERERSTEARGPLDRIAAAREALVRGAKARPALTAAVTILSFGAVTLGARALVRVVRGRREEKHEAPTERPPEPPVATSANRK